MRPDGRSPPNERLRGLHVAASLVRLRNVRPQRRRDRARRAQEGPASTWPGGRTRCRRPRAPAPIRRRKDVSYQYDTRTPSTEVRKPRIPSVRVRLSLHYRVHSRQILCVGGNELPLGWSFLSIARASAPPRARPRDAAPGQLPSHASTTAPRPPQVPMRWTPGDVWVWEGDFVAGTRVEYKYVVLEEQSWTRLCDLAAEGIVTRTRPTYRRVPGSLLGGENAACSNYGSCPCLEIGGVGWGFARVGIGAEVLCGVLAGKGARTSFSSRTWRWSATRWRSWRGNRGRTARCASRPFRRLSGSSSGSSRGSRNACRGLARPRCEWAKGRSGCMARSPSVAATGPCAPPRFGTVRARSLRRTPADEAPWEELGVDADGTVVIERRDVWGLPPRRPPQMEGLSFGA